MIFSELILILLIAALANPGTVLVQAQDNFQCGDADQAEVPTTQEFDSISASWDCADHDSPETVHWHIYTIAGDGEGEVPAKISMYPPGLVEPYIVGMDRTLRFRLDEQVISNFTENGSIQAAVNLYVPPSKMKSVLLPGVDQVVEIVHNMPESLTVKNSGVDNEVRITSPSAAVDYQDSGVDNDAEIEAGAGSSVAVSGVESDVEIAVPDDQLTVRLSGVDLEVTIQGMYKSATMSGVDCEVKVNGDTCDKVTDSGVGNKCTVVTDTVQVEAVPCLSTTKVDDDSDCSASSTYDLRFVTWVLVVGHFLLAWFSVTY